MNSYQKLSVAISSILGLQGTSAAVAADTSAENFILAEFPQRPRVLGVKFTYKFSSQK